MIVVTGLRSGTSLMLQTLNLLGYPIEGYAFHDEFMHKELNPKGYFHLPMCETLGGIKHHEYSGKAVRLGGVDLNSTNQKYINKVIWCRRNPEECKKSIMKMLLADFNIIKLEPTYENADAIYLINIEATYEFLKTNKVSYIEIYYEEMLLDSKNTIESVKMFLGITNTDINKAINNIDKREVICQQQQ